MLRHRQFPRRQLLIESVVFMIGGGGTALADGIILVAVCQTGGCHTSNLLHVLVGLLVFQGGLLMFLSLKMSMLQDRFYSYASAIVLSSVGVMFLFHEQDNEWYTVVHQWLAGVMMLAGIIKSIADDVPRLRLLAGFLFILGSILLSFGGISTYKFFKHHKFNGHHTAIFGFNLSFLVVFLVIGLRHVYEQKFAHKWNLDMWFGVVDSGTDTEMRHIAHTRLHD